MSTKFDFDSAERLVAAINKNTDSMTEEKNRIYSSFKNLGSSFKDSGYAKFEADFSAAYNNIEAVIQDLRNIANAVDKYKESLRNSL